VPWRFCNCYGFFLVFEILNFRQTNSTQIIEPSWKMPSVYSNQRVCRCWKLQDQPFAFSGRFGAACIPLQGRQHALGQFSAACNQTGIKISTNDLCVQWGDQCAANWGFLYALFHVAPRHGLELVYVRDHQPFWIPIFVYRLMRRATSLKHTSEIKILRNLPSIILVLVKTLIMLMLFLEQVRWRPGARGHHVGDPWCTFIEERC